MLWLVLYLRGYLKIKIVGAFSEQILNLTARNRIRLWDLRCTKDSITGYITVKGFKKLRIIKRGTKTRVKIIGRYGLPFVLKKYNKRYGIALGAVIFFAVLKIMSGFIWTVNIEGNTSVTNAEIISALKGLGIGEGTQIKSISPVRDAQRLILEMPRLAWASLNIEGSVLTVNITEAKDTDNKDNTPTNLKAATDGTITDIDVISGNTVVKVGDTVAAGDVLVSGISERIFGTQYVRSKGTVTAKTERSFSSHGDFKQKIQVKTGKKIKRRVLSVFGVDIPLYLGEIREGYIAVKKEHRLKLFGREIPIRLTVKTFELTEEKEVVYTEKQLLDILEKDIENQINQAECGKITLKNSAVTPTEGGLKLEKIVNCEENIAKEEILLINTIN